MIRTERYKACQRPDHHAQRIAYSNAIQSSPRHTILILALAAGVAVTSSADTAGAESSANNSASNDLAVRYSEYRSFDGATATNAGYSPHNTRAGTQHGLPDQMEIVYNVSRGNIDLGVILSSLKKAGDSYQSVTTTRPNSLIKLLGADDVRQETEFQLTESGVNSVSYMESRGDRPVRRVEFDEASGLIRFTVEAQFDGDAADNSTDHNAEGDDRRLLKRIEKTPEYDTIDIGSLPFYLMTKPIAELSGNRLGIVTGKKIGHYQIDEPVAEMMQTADGELLTWRIENQPIKTPRNSEFPMSAGWSGSAGSTARVETGHGNSTTVNVDSNAEVDPKDTSSIIVWVSPAHNNLPVKIVKRKGGKETTMVLANMGQEQKTRLNNER